MNDKFNIKLEAIEQAKADLFNSELKLTDKLKKKRQAFLLTVPLLALINQKKGNQNFQSIVENTSIVKYDFGEIVFNNNDNRTFNIILKGTIMLFTKQKEAQTPKFHKKLGPGEYFGEKMQLGKEELESARCVSLCYLLQMNMQHFYYAFSGYFVYNQLRDRINLLKSIWVFSNMKTSFLQTVLLSSELKKYVRGTAIFKQGDQANHLLVILDGQITLSTFSQGKLRPFSILTGHQVCGVQQIAQSRPFSFYGVCTSDYTEILKVSKQIICQILQNDILRETIGSLRKLSSQLKEKNINSQRLLSKSSLQRSNSFQNKQRKFSHRRVKTTIQQDYKPLNKMTILNQLFEKQIQLKYPKIRRIRQQFIKDQQRQTIYSSKRISSYLNRDCTYDKQIIVNYLWRKERKYQSALKKQLQFQNKRIIVVPQLKVDRSSAVKNHKRKLKKSRKSQDHFLEQN